MTIYRVDSGDSHTERLQQGVTQNECSDAMQELLLTERSLRIVIRDDMQDLLKPDFPVSDAVSVRPATAYRLTEKPKGLQHAVRTKKPRDMKNAHSGATSVHQHAPHSTRFNSTGDT